MISLDRRNKCSAPVDTSLRLRLAALTNALGQLTVADRLGLAPQTIRRALDGRPIHPGTRELIAHRLGEVVR